MDDSPPTPPRARLSRKDRLIRLIAILRDGALHKGPDLARALNVTPRTLYRDMTTLIRSGIPVTGTRGRGYQMREQIMLPPLNLFARELEALHLGLAVMTEAEDPALRDAARSLARKIDDALPEARVAASTGWGLAVHPFADTASGIRHIPALRRAIRHRQQLRLTCLDDAGRRTTRTVTPLQLDYWGRVWTCTIRQAALPDPQTLRVDRIETIDPPDDAPDRTRA